MGRSKVIENNDLIELIKKFYIEECKGNAKKLKLPLITKYVLQNGYPNYKVESLRRNEVARNYIDSLKKIEEGKTLCILATYKTLDIESFLDTNKTRESLKKSLTILDSYYRTVAGTATEINKKYKDLEQKYEEASEKLNKAREDIEVLTHDISSLKVKNKSLRSDNNVLKGIVDDYIYPDIANELLIKDGVLSNADTSVDTYKLQKNLLSADTKIEKKSTARSGSAIIQNIFDKFED